MMFLPQIPYTSNKVSQQVVQFGSLHYDRGGKDGDFSETLNLSSKRYPTLSQRGARKVTAEYDHATALYARNKLIVVDGTNFIYDGKVVGQVSEGEKNITSVNSKVVIFPDKKYYDVEEDKFGDMEASLEVASDKITWAANSVTVSSPETPLDELFAVGQGIEISGSSIEANNKTVVVLKAESNRLTFSANAFATGTESNTVTIQRKVPDFTCICESANRLWGAEDETIYASALGDPLTFFAYQGLSTDAFAVAVGTDGAFTGCIAYSSNVLFFKENALHKVLGGAPSEYRVYNYTVPGVQAGSEKSMVVINELLFYKGVSGVYAYSGASPSLVSENFGTRRFQHAAAGTDGTKYYISMQEEGTDAWNLFVFDPDTGVWLREDDTHAIDFARQDTMLHLLDAKSGDVYTVEQGTEALDWMAQFYPFDDTAYGKRGYSKLWLKLELDPGAWVKAEVSCDTGPFRQVGLWNERRETFTANIVPGRCDTFRLRLSGHGGCVVKSLVREFDVGSER